MRLGTAVFSIFCIFVLYIVLSLTYAQYSVNRQLTKQEQEARQAEQQKYDAEQKIEREREEEISREQVKQDRIAYLKQELANAKLSLAHDEYMGDKYSAKEDRWNIKQTQSLLEAYPTPYYPPCWFPNWQKTSKYCVSEP